MCAYLYVLLCVCVCVSECVCLCVSVCVFVFMSKFWRRYYVRIVSDDCELSLYDDDSCQV